MVSDTGAVFNKCLYTGKCFLGTMVCQINIFNPYLTESLRCDTYIFPNFQSEQTGHITTSLCVWLAETRRNVILWHTVFPLLLAGCPIVCSCSFNRAAPFWIRVNCRNRQLATVPTDLPREARYL